MSAARWAWPLPVEFNELRCRTIHNDTSLSLAAWIRKEEVNLNRVRATLYSNRLSPKPNLTLHRFSQRVTRRGACLHLHCYEELKDPPFLISKPCTASLPVQTGGRGHCRA